MKISRFTHLLGNNTVWHSLFLQRYKISPETYLALEKAKRTDGFIDFQDIYRELVSFGYLVVSDQEDDRLLDQIVQKLPIPVIQSLFLIATNKCNLDCNYCLYRANGSQTLTGPKQDMTTELACNAIDLFTREIRENIHGANYWQAITFYGGEPLINMDTLKKCVEYIRFLQDSGTLWEGTELVINTNGLLIDDQFAAYAAEEKIEVQVSLDGPEEIHNIYRVTQDGHGSFIQVVKAIDRLLAANANVIPLVTVTEANIPHLTELAIWMAKELGITRYITNILMATTGDAQQGYSKRAAEAMLSAYYEATNHAGAVDLTISGQLQAFEGPCIAKSSCGASGRKLTVFPNGNIHTCQALEESGISKVGSLVSFNRNNQQWQTWANRTRFTNKVCLSCPVLGACGGGCPAGAYHSHGRIYGQDPNHCSWIRTLFTKWSQDK